MCQMFKSAVQWLTFPTTNMQMMVNKVLEYEEAMQRVSLHKLVMCTWDTLLTQPLERKREDAKRGNRKRKREGGDEI